MKKLLPILCVLTLLLCGCGAQPQVPTLSLAALPDPVDALQAQKDFERILDYAINDGDITHLVLYNVTFTDPEFIYAYLSKLQELKFEPSRNDGGYQVGDRTYSISLGYENGAIWLGNISKEAIYIYYYGRGVEYRLKMLNPEVGQEIFQMADEQGVWDAVTQWLPPSRR